MRIGSCLLLSSKGDRMARTKAVSRNIGGEQIDNRTGIIPQHSESIVASLVDGPDDGSAIDGIDTTALSQAGNHGSDDHLCDNVQPGSPFDVAWLFEEIDRMRGIRPEDFEEIASSSQPSTGRAA